ncbi:DHS-like NAD/FAD-binding domain-containing protein [Daldinia caldariorum]|uniref:DHS-like NAD/FAD-binding domain-containing protein n=1 Tax=Daldinia caldariorum TaxID=326644 RepID=UPI002007B982|nr:DHS-like NAD/FAD-binding domain-containing protein [Daldinia caldariorum]KAI1467168.1 DHS-like NAD/FAD-binding domain-containing protein [Daldinia caldariorum]
MRKPYMRIPYTDILPSPTTIPRTATTLSGAIAALQEFFGASSAKGAPSTVALTGAGISVASGLSDYRGPNGTYRVNKTYRPIYYSEFIQNHEARKRYWARSFLGWTTLLKGKPNAGHYAVKHLGDLGLVQNVITQNVDSFHLKAHPQLPTIELHGYLRSCICTSCHQELSRETFQHELARLNPAWDTFLQEILASGALDTENPDERRARGLKTNPDGDVDLPGAPYTTFRYPACPTCLTSPPAIADGSLAKVEVDTDGALMPTSTAGILKPAVIMFGENIRVPVKAAAEQAIENAGSLLVLGTSLATYSAWRLVKKAKDRGIPIAIVNLGGVRGEETFFADLDPSQKGNQGARIELSTDELLPALVEQLRQSSRIKAAVEGHDHRSEQHGAAVFKDMMS